MAEIVKDISLKTGTGLANVIGEKPNLNFLNIVTSIQNLTLFEAEEKFSVDVEQLWFRKHFINTFYISGLYLLVIFSGRYFMKSRERFELRGLLVLWNVALAFFSLMGSIRVVPELLHVLFSQPNGFYRSVCTTGFFDNKVIAYWNYLSVLSKWIELGDTAFIVLRKQPLIFLHWYHHITVLIFTWYTAIDCPAPSRWYSSLNYMIHASMYTYYAFRALRYKIPKNVSAVLTSLQILQMMIDFGAIYAAYLYKSNGYRCDISDGNIRYGLAMFASYWVLFGHYFYNAYLSKMTNRAHQIKTIGMKKQS